MSLWDIKFPFPSERHIWPNAVIPKSRQQLREANLNPAQTCKEGEAYE